MNDGLEVQNTTEFKQGKAVEMIAKSSSASKPLC